MKYVYIYVRKIFKEIKSIDKKAILLIKFKKKVNRIYLNPSLDFTRKIVIASLSYVRKIICTSYRKQARFSMSNLNTMPMIA